MRIVSLLPSATEIVCALGLKEQLVGVTHECDFPSYVLGLPKVTRTVIPTGATSAEIDTLVRERLRTQRALYSLDMEVLESLRPDLIVTQALCDVCAVAEEEVRAAACTLPGQPCVINLEPRTLPDVLNCLRQVGAATGTGERAEQAIGELKARVDAVATRAARLPNRFRVTLLEWIDPPFSCGHWSPELVRLAGGMEGIGQEGQPSRCIPWEEVISWQPEVLFIACCGFGVERTLRDLPLLASKPGWDTLPCVRMGRVYVTDGSAYFSRPGPRLVDSLEILAHALDPTAHPLVHGLPAAVNMGASF
jgi:iron complex transport system substrate-binding protein